MASNTDITIPQHVGEAAEVDYSDTQAMDFGPLARDRIPVRSLGADDLHALVAIDRRITGSDRSAYFERMVTDALTESDVRISLVAEIDDVPVGFIMARVDVGEFGQVETTAVIDTIGVDPDYQHRGVGRALISQLLTNLSTLRVETVRTIVSWQENELLDYLGRSGFRPSQQLCFEQDL